MSPLDFLSILHTAERLKDTPRHCTTTNGRTESVAEHSWRTALMAMLLKNEFPQIDIDKVTAMCIIHDLGECFTGDIPTFVKTDSDRKTESAQRISHIHLVAKRIRPQPHLRLRCGATLALAHCITPRGA